jgi:hypothetical protein
MIAISHTKQSVAPVASMAKNVHIHNLSYQIICGICGTQAGETVWQALQSRHVLQGWAGGAVEAACMLHDADQLRARLRDGALPAACRLSTTMTAETAFALLHRAYGMTAHVREGIQQYFQPNHGQQLLEHIPQQQQQQQQQQQGEELQQEQQLEQGAPLQPHLQPHQQRHQEEDEQCRLDEVAVLLRDASKGWSPVRHCLYGARFRQRVFLMLLLHARIQADYHASIAAAAASVGATSGETSSCIVEEITSPSTLMLQAARITSTTSAAASSLKAGVESHQRPGAVSHLRSAPLVPLPIEVWLLIVGFFSRREFL